MKTPVLNDKEIKRAWKLVDADGQTLGRLASKIAIMLIGKDKPEYSPHQDWGDNIIVVNAEKITLSGNKVMQKIYFSHSQHPGGAKYTSFQELMTKKPQEIIRRAVKGMLKTKKPLGRKMFKKLYVYVGPEHPHQAQKPQKIELN